MLGSGFPEATLSKSIDTVIKIFSIKFLCVREVTSVAMNKQMQRYPITKSYAKTTD